MQPVRAYSLKPCARYARARKRRLAADSILRSAFKSWEQLELEARLQRLEDAASGQGDGERKALKFKFEYGKRDQDPNG
jgi:hypothetical protein